jgi:hypothetical protein
MGKVWVLDTETKGTGAEMVPLDKARNRSKPAIDPVYVPKERAPRPTEEPAPRKPPRFKVVDVMTREVLAEGADARATVGLLEELRSVVDVRVYVWNDETESWRLLTLQEQKALWDLRGRRRPPAPAH